MLVNCKVTTHLIPICSGLVQIYHHVLIFWFVQQISGTVVNPKIITHLIPVCFGSVKIYHYFFIFWFVPLSFHKHMDQQISNQAKLKTRYNVSFILGKQAFNPQERSTPSLENQSF